MKRFSAVAVVKQPLRDVWTTVRDRMPELGALVDDVASIVLVERSDLGDGRVRLVNEWTATQTVPELLAKPLKTSTIGWVDTAEWDDHTHRCTWSIRPHVLEDHIECGGTTSYASALGGRGTRVTFEGTFDLASGALGGLAKPLERPVTTFIEAIVSTLIPKNTRKVVEAAADLIAGELAD